LNIRHMDGAWRLNSMTL